MSNLGDGAPIPAKTDWEVGRLVLAPDHRSDINLLRRCLQLTLEHFCAHAQVGHCYAACTHVLARLYRRCGFSALAANVPLPGTEKSYSIICGTAFGVASGLASYASPVMPQ